MVGSANAKDPKEEFLSQIVSRFNEIFLMDKVTDKTAVNFSHTVADKVRENGLMYDLVAFSIGK